MIVAEQNRSIPDIFAAEGEDYFRSLEKATLLKAIAEHKDKGSVLSTGGGIVIQEENRKALLDHSVSIWLYAGAETIIKRIQPGSRPLLDVDNPVEKANQLLASRISKYASSAAMLIDTDRKSEQEILDTLYEEVSTAFGY